MLREFMSTTFFTLTHESPKQLYVCESKKRVTGVAKNLQHYCPRSLGFAYFLGRNYPEKNAFCYKSDESGVAHHTVEAIKH